MINNSTDKIKYKISNWQEYNKALKNRGSLTFWVNEDFDKGWLATSNHKAKRGHPLTYSNLKF